MGVSVVEAVMDGQPQMCAPVSQPKPLRENTILLTHGNEKTSSFLYNPPKCFWFQDSFEGDYLIYKFINKIVFPFHGW